eukprot:SAG31_NODE_2580_length_5438_cov_8.500843_4_plen_135_part_00
MCFSLTHALWPTWKNALRQCVLNTPTTVGVSAAMGPNTRFDVVNFDAQWERAKTVPRRVGSRRDVGMTLEGGTPAYVEALDQAVCAIMIEKRQAVDDIQALLSVPGVDMVQVSDRTVTVALSRTHFCSRFSGDT